VTRRIVIAGGGTGGHVFVASAIADALRQQGKGDAELCFMGSRRGMERTLLRDAPSELILLGGRGIKRSWKPKAVLDNVGALFGLVGAVLTAWWFFARERPRAMVSVGGYAALPAGLAAWLWRCPIVVINIDAVAGRTNRLLGQRAVASCVAFAGSGLEREVVTGAPVRPIFFDLPRDEASRRAAKVALSVAPDQPLVAVVTGSLGAGSVNRAVAGLTERWRDRAVTIIHVTGSRDADQYRSMAGNYGSLDYRVVAFEDNVAGLYQAADVGITRAGALTVAELCAINLASVLVPLPGAPGDHQTKNARALVVAGAALMLADGDLDAQRLDDLLSGLLDDPLARQSMERALSGLAHPYAARDAAKVVLDHAR
jgi:UDP-N-acetylglucosamine--N-acetylmuramyl-(pentapeptide) pyrophosphoryl-undecaprenol N-acetylglucosamine transferase